MQPIKLLNLAHMGMGLSIALSLGRVAMGYWFYHGLTGQFGGMAQPRAINGG